jgi:RiboL-PSP-HEPN
VSARKAKAWHSTGAKRRIGLLRKQLDELYVRADPRTVDDPELASDLARYLCVRVAGFFEQATAILLRDHCEKGSWGTAQSFALSWLEKMPNLRPEAFTGLLGRFDTALAAAAKSLLEEEERSSTLNALIGIRNDIAHGKNQGLSREQAWSYYEVVTTIIDWLEERLSAE